MDSFDLATLAALRYARSQRPTTLRAVHFVIDTAQADQLREEWTRAGMDVVLDFLDCPDRRLARAAAELVSAEAAQPGVQVTVVLPRRSYSPLLGRLLHDRTADKIAAVVSRIPNAAATIIPFDVRSRLEVLHARQVAQADKLAAQQAGLTVPPDGAAPPAATAGPAGPGPGGHRDRSGPGWAGRDRATPAAASAPGGTAATAAQAPQAAPAQAGDGTDGTPGLPPVIAAPGGLRRRLRGRRGRPAGQPPTVPTEEHASYDRPAPLGWGEPDRLADQAGPGHGRGPGPRGGDPPGGAQLCAGRRDRRLHRRPDGAVLRPVAHPRPDMRGPGPVPRPDRPARRVAR